MSNTHEWDEGRDQARNRVRFDMGYHVRSEIDESVWCHVMDEIWTQTIDQVVAQVDDHVWYEAYSLMYPNDWKLEDE